MAQTYINNYLKKQIFEISNPNHGLAILSTDGHGTESEPSVALGFLIHSTNQKRKLKRDPSYILLSLISLFKERSGVPVVSKQSAGRSTLTEDQRQVAKRIKYQGRTTTSRWKEKCQGWVLDMFISLEAEKLQY
ncbi:hypothetical protein ACJ72_05966 [Emergomyces africanus]|uniref:Uncharacterized protein n=1 Tax=Emergomyces africanus TaxID=1955775 RepID=A0A1B7NSF2_9EURO|nr:hypothetical protein ACJ72_05966 [Emergomyces africanus]